MDKPNTWGQYGALDQAQAKLQNGSGCSIAPQSQRTTDIVSLDILPFFYHRLYGVEQATPNGSTNNDKTSRLGALPGHKHILTGDPNRDNAGNNGKQDGNNQIPPFAQHN